MKLNWKMPVLLLAVGGAAAFVAINEPARTRAVGFWGRALARVSAAEVPQRPAQSAELGPKLPRGVIVLTTAQKAALGVDTAEVLAQTEPVKIPVNGVTSYNLDAQNKIRPKFSVVVEKVYVALGQAIKPGDPIVDIYSADLAKAKLDFLSKKLQSDLDQIEANRSKSLRDKQPPSISERELLAAVNTAKQSQQAAEDLLHVYGLTQAEVEKIKTEEGDQKAKMTMRSLAEGIVVKRDVVVGNRYDDSDVLLNIAPLDHFWVYGSIYPSDAGRVQLGQDWEIYIPFLDQTFRGKVESVSSSVDEKTKTFQIRATVPNLSGRMKADMMIGGNLEIPAFTKARVVVPRLALLSTDGADYVFVSKGGDPEQFERRRVRVIQESSERVILVADNLKPGERVASRGGLMLAQMYEDANMTETGAPL